MNAWQMPTKIEEIQTEKYGITLDGILGDVDENGALQNRFDGKYSPRTSTLAGNPAGS